MDGIYIYIQQTTTNDNNNNNKQLQPSCTFLLYRGPNHGAHLVSVCMGMVRPSVAWALRTAPKGFLEASEWGRECAWTSFFVIYLPTWTCICIYAGLGAPARRRKFCVHVCMYVWSWEWASERVSEWGVLVCLSDEWPGRNRDMCDVCVIDMDLITSYLLASVVYGRDMMWFLLLHEILGMVIADIMSFVCT